MYVIKRTKKILRELKKLIYQTETINYKNQGFINLIDVGAIGKLPSPWLENANSVNKLLRFEPRESASKSKDIISLDVAVGGENGKRAFYVYKGNNSQGSSFYEQNVEYVDVNFEELKKRGNPALAATWHERSQLVKTMQVNCQKLDKVLADLKYREPFDFLKVDAQGAEYEILLGAEKFLKNDCLGITLELFDIPLYKGIALRDKVVAYLDRMGFEPAQTLEAHGSFNSVQDYVFLKKHPPTSAQKKIDFIRKIYEID